MMTTPRSRPARLILDLSRLLSRLMHTTPTGVDRCEMAYARGLLAAVPDRLSFAAVHPSGQYGQLPRNAVLDFLDRTEERWDKAEARSRLALRADAARDLVRLWPARQWRTRPETAGVYLQASPNNLTKPAILARALQIERARFVCLVHDLIPITFPEYARPGGDQLHLRRVKTIAELADGIILNSHATLAALSPYLDRHPRNRLTCVAHLGVGSPVAPAEPPIAVDKPYFVCVGTIEPRKNHLLLLHLWRDMAERHGPDNIPKLILIGRRGWENEQVIDLLERCPALSRCVEEHNGLNDGYVRRLMRGACALLLPSFAEGYGMPVSEALALGVPVICSDLAALREAGGTIPDYLDPLDGRAWMEAIDGYCSPGAARRVAQLDRMQSFVPTSWTQHIDLVLTMCDQLTETLPA